MAMRVALLAVLVWGLYLPDAWGQRRSALEMRVKAAYLLNFGRYVTWPGADSSKPLRICVSASDEFVEILKRTAEDRRVQGRVVEPVRLNEPRKQLRDCEIAYFSDELPTGRQHSLVREVRDLPILTVGESERFLDHGGIVRFVYVKDTIRFAVNHDAAREVGLEISSRVLALATNIREKRSP